MSKRRNIFSRILSKPVAFLVRDFKLAVSYRLQFFLQGSGILLTILTFSLFSKMLSGQNLPFLEPYGGDFFSFVIIGIAFSDYLVSSTNTFASEIRAAQVVGTLESLLVTPTSILTILFSSYMYTLFFTSFRILLYLILGVCIFDVQLNAAGLGTVLPAFFLSLLPFFGLGLLSATFILVFKQGSPISGLIAVSSGLLGGVLYPVAVLPSWLKPISALLPITHGLEAMRQVLLNGAGLRDIHTQIVILLIFSIVLLTTGISSIYFGLRIAKKEGSLLHY
ncbi:MAG: ABC transporter permease [Desulfobulbaceae bacterium]|nr:ABC transporter permease [Desulfobulbaceae bacterium]